MIPMNADYQRCLYYQDNHHRTCTRQGCTECALYCPYLNHKTAVVCTLPHMKTGEPVPRRTPPSLFTTEDLSHEDRRDDPAFDHGLACVRQRGIAEIISRVEALGTTGVGKELPSLDGIVPVTGWLPVKLEARGKAAG